MHFSQLAKAARPSEIISSQHEVIQQQARIIDVLKGALAATGMSLTPAAADWAIGLTTQERALVGALYARFPRCISKFDLLELLPGYDRVEERQLGVVNVVVHKVRRKLGPDAIVTVRGLGYRLGDRFHQTVPKDQTAGWPEWDASRRTG